MQPWEVISVDTGQSLMLQTTLATVGAMDCFRLEVTNKDSWYLYAQTPVRREQYRIDLSNCFVEYLGSSGIWRPSFMQRFRLITE